MVSRECFYGMDFKSFGYHTAEERNAKIQSLCSAEIERCYKKAKEIIGKNWDYFDALVAALLKKDMLTEMEIADIRQGYSIKGLAYSV